MVKMPHPFIPFFFPFCILITLSFLNFNEEKTHLSIRINLYRHANSPAASCASANMIRPIEPFDLLRLHAVLVSYWKEHGEQIKASWNSLSHDERVQCFEATQKDVLSRLIDGFWVPEWNLEQITAPDSTLFLDLMEARAARSIFQQNFIPFKDHQSDYDFIRGVIAATSYGHELSDDAGSMHFVGEKKDGASEDIASATTFRSHVARNGKHDVGILRVPKVWGQMIYGRQCLLMMCLYTMVCEILEREPLVTHPVQMLASTPGTPHPELSASAKSNLIAQTPLAKLLLPGLISRALEHVYGSENFDSEHMDPVKFSEYMPRYIKNRSEKVHDAHGRTLDASASKSVGASFF